MNVTKPKETALLWMAKVVAGGLVLVFLGIHFYMNHLFAPTGLLKYQDVVKYYHNPGVIIMEALFLIFVISHAFLGLRSILLDMNLKYTVQKVLDWALTVVGCSACIYGIWLLIVIAARPV
jgi:succinate dehydrogenase / fumarate reductase, membrane anchor subunit